MKQTLNVFIALMANPCFSFFFKYRFRHRLGTGTVLKVSIWHWYRKKPKRYPTLVISLYQWLETLLHLYIQLLANLCLCFTYIYGPMPSGVSLPIHSLGALSPPTELVRQDHISNMGDASILNPVWMWTNQNSCFSCFKSSFLFSQWLIASKI